MKKKKKRKDVKREIKMQKVLKEHRNAWKDDRKGKIFWNFCRKCKNQKYLIANNLRNQSKFRYCVFSVKRHIGNKWKAKWLESRFMLQIYATKIKHFKT